MRDYMDRWVTPPERLLHLPGVPHLHANSRPVQYRKWSPSANDPETANDPQNGPQMILDRKWSPKKDWL